MLMVILKGFHCYIYQGLEISLVQKFLTSHFSMFTMLFGGFLDLTAFHGYILETLVIELISIGQSC